MHARFSRNYRTSVPPPPSCGGCGQVGNRPGVDPARCDTAKGFQDLIETVHDPYWKIPDGTSIKRLLLARIVAPGFFEEPIERLKLSPRILNSLNRAHVTNLGQVFDLSDDELLHIRNFGEKSLLELKDQLEPLMYEHDEMPPADY